MVPEVAAQDTPQDPQASKTVTPLGKSLRLDLHLLFSLIRPVTIDINLSAAIPNPSLEISKPKRRR